jgi:hypothetical protein
MGGSVESMPWAEFANEVHGLLLVVDVEHFLADLW